MSGGRGMNLVGVPEAQQEGRIEHRRYQGDGRAENRILAEGLALPYAGDEGGADEDDGNRHQGRRVRPLAEENPGRGGHEHDLRVGEEG